MKRQPIRQALLLVSLLLFPLTLYYFSPALVISGAFGGIVTGSLIMFGLQFVASLVFGRAFCGWVCPAGGLQEACSRVNRRRVVRGHWVKYLIWLPWVAIIVWGFVSAGGPRSVQPLYQTTHGISVANSFAYIIYYAVVGLVVILSLTSGRRAFCHHVCWMAPFMVIGLRIRQIAGWPALHLRMNSERCVGCGRCSGNCPMSLDVPGVLMGKARGQNDCILCGECVDNCPKGAIRYAFGPQRGRAALTGRTTPGSSGESSTPTVQK